MSLPEGYTQLPTYFAPGAFEMVRQYNKGIAYNLDHLAGINHLAETMLKCSLLGDPEDLALVYRFAKPGYEQPEHDKHFPRANYDAPYYSADLLALHPRTQAQPITKAEIEGSHENLVHIQVQDLTKPMVWWLADSIAYPPAEDHKMKASLGAWGRQFKEAFSFNEGAKKSFRLKVVSQHIGAIILLPRGAGPLTPTV